MVDEIRIVVIKRCLSPLRGIETVEPNVTSVRGSEGQLCEYLSAEALVVPPKMPRSAVCDLVSDKVLNSYCKKKKKSDEVREGKKRFYTF